VKSAIAPPDTVIATHHVCDWLITATSVFEPRHQKYMDMSYFATLPARQARVRKSA
jgi:hypothetical protein